MVSKLEIQIDVTAISEATKALDELAQAARRAEDALGRLQNKELSIEVSTVADDRPRFVGRR